MSTTQLSRSAVTFVREHVDHVVKLQFLLGIHGAPDYASDVSSMARLLDVPKAQVRDMANELVGEGLLRVESDSLALTPRTVDDWVALSDLHSLYRRNQGAVLELLRVLQRHP